MVGYDFIFQDESLRDMGFIMAKPNDDDVSGLEREILKGTVTSFKSRPVHYGTVYSDTAVLSFFIIKDYCKDSEMKMTKQEIGNIQAWLTSPKLPQSLYVVESDKRKKIEYRGIFNEVSPYFYNGVNGLYLKFTCDSPYAYEHNTVITPQYFAQSGITLNISHSSTDEMKEYTYPKIIYNPSGSGTLTFTSNTDDGRTMEFTFDGSCSEYVIDCGMKTIKGDGVPISLSNAGMNVTTITDYNNVNSGMFKMYWLRFLPGNNSVYVKGNGMISIEFDSVKKWGGLVYV